MLASPNWTGVLDTHKSSNTIEHYSGRFTVDDAKSIMLSRTSQIRVVEIGLNVYRVGLIVTLFVDNVSLTICV